MTDADSPYELHCDALVWRWVSRTPPRSYLRRVLSFAREEQARSYATRDERGAFSQLLAYASGMTERG